MTTAACAIAGGACSSLLGLDDPKPNVDGGGGDGGGGDAGPSPERLEFRLGDFAIKQGQRVGVHVTAVFRDGSTEEATATATYSSTNRAIADVVIPGQIDGISQGMATISASIGSSQPGTAAVNVLAKSCSPVINEFQTGGTTSADDEWVEILNPCAAPVTIEGWTLVYRGPNTTGTTDATLLVTLKGELMPGDLRLYAGPGFTGTATPDDRWLTGALGGANGAIGIRKGPKDTGMISDTVAYGAVAAMHPFAEGTELGPMANSRPAQRLPFDGHDEDNNVADFMTVQTGSPRAPNAP